MMKLRSQKSSAQRLAHGSCAQGVAVHNWNSARVGVSNVKDESCRLSSCESAPISARIGDGEAGWTYAERTPEEPKYNAGMFSPSNTICVSVSRDLGVFHAGSVSIRGCSVGSTESRVCRR